MNQAEQNKGQKQDQKDKPRFPNQGITWALVWVLVLASVALWLWGQVMGRGSFKDTAGD